MKRCISALVLAVAMFSGSPVYAGKIQPDLPAAEVDSLQASLKALEKQRANAILRRDVALLGRLMDRYYRHVDSQGRVRSKVELLSAIERDDFAFHQYESESTEIQLLDGGKVAVIAGIFRSLQAGRKMFRGRYIRVWVHEPDGWKNTFHQATEIRQQTHKQ